MLKIVSAYIGEKRYRFLNTANTVGKRGLNLPGDVMLVQALFNYIAPIVQLGGYDSTLINPPQVTGICDEATEYAIYAYQMKFGPSLMKADGTIHPPSYTNRKLSAGKPVMTMTLMQLQADSAAKMWADDHWIKGLHGRWRDLYMWIEFSR